MKIECAYKELVSLEKIIPNPRNPNTHSKEQIKLLAKIIDAQGWRAPISVSNRSGFIVRGHARLLAAQLLKLEMAPVDFQDYESEAQEWADLIADNRIAELAEIDQPILKDILQELDDGSFDMDLTGFDSSALEQLMLQTHEDGLTDDDEIPEPKESICKPGDLWVLGNHRLLCGDATVEADVAKLMAGEKADMVFTDPPYGVSYQTIRNSGIGKIENDELRGDKLEEFIGEWFCLLNCDGDKFIFCDWKTLRNFQNVIESNQQSIGTVIVWNKETSSHNFIHWNPVYEMLIFIGSQKKRDHKCEYNLWTFPREFSKEHSTPKPVALCSKGIDRSSQINDIVLDPFLGSGSTLIACEKLGRRCYGMEIDPHYCDVIITRWEQFTGKQAELQKSH